MEGVNKLLLNWGDSTLIERAIREVLKTNYATVVITGHEKERIEEAVKTYPIKLIYNEKYKQGQETSIRKALEFIDDDDSVFIPADLPFITSDDFN